MRVHHVVTIGFLGLLAGLPAGCGRMTAEEAADVRKSFGIPADMPMKELGVVEFRAGIPKRVRLGAGKHCTITANVLTNGQVQLNLLYESKGEVIEGVKTQPHSEQSRLVFRPAPGWLCLPPMGGARAFQEHKQCAGRRCQHVVAALQPIVLP